jgi:ferritin-like metal-binding protein YciE
MLFQGRETMGEMKTKKNTEEEKNTLSLKFYKEKETSTGIAGEGFDDGSGTYESPEEIVPDTLDDFFSRSSERHAVTLPEELADIAGDSIDAGEGMDHARTAPLEQTREFQEILDRSGKRAREMMKIDVKHMYHMIEEVIGKIGKYIGEIEPTIKDYHKYASVVEDAPRKLRARVTSYRDMADLIFTEMSTGIAQIKQKKENVRAGGEKKVKAAEEVKYLREEIDRVKEETDRHLRQYENDIEEAEKLLEAHKEKAEKEIEEFTGKYRENIDRAAAIYEDGRGQIEAVVTAINNVDRRLKDVRDNVKEEAGRFLKENINGFVDEARSRVIAFVHDVEKMKSISCSLRDTLLEEMTETLPEIRRKAGEMVNSIETEFESIVVNAAGLFDRVKLLLKDIEVMLEGLSGSAVDLKWLEEGKEFIFKVLLSYKNDHGQEIKHEEILPERPEERLVIENFTGRYSVKGAGRIAGRKKYNIDKNIFLYDEEVTMDRDMTKNIKNAGYWKKYIKAVTNGKIDVDQNRLYINNMSEQDYSGKYVGTDKLKEPGTGLQFYLIKDGFEGFLPPDVQIKWATKYKGLQRIKHDFKNGNKVEFFNHLGGEDEKGAREYFHANEALVIFDKNGAIVDVFLLLMSFNRKNDHMESSVKTNKKSWNDKMVCMAMPPTKGYDYPGLSVYEPGHYAADIHGMNGSHNSYQVCYIQPDGKGSKKPWYDFVSKYFPGNWKKIVKDSRELHKVEGSRNTARYKIGHIWVAGY